MTDGRRSNGKYERGLSIEDRFWRKVDKTSTCWLWTASKVPGTGYASFQVSSAKRVNAHRWAYEALVGPIPRGMQLDHLCRVRHCVNPAHLEAVPPVVNVRRGTSPGAEALRRTKCEMGHPYSQWGVFRARRRVCRLCRAAYARAYRTRVDRTHPVDLEAALVVYEMALRISLPARRVDPVPKSHRGMSIPTTPRSAA